MSADGDADPTEEAAVHSRTVTLTLAEGLHVRPCSMIAKAVAGGSSPVSVEANGQSADASSVFDLMGLGLECGSSIRLSGSDADAVDRVALLFETSFENETAA